MFMLLNLSYMQAQCDSFTVDLQISDTLACPGDTIEGIIVFSGGNGPYTGYYVVGSAPAVLFTTNNDTISFAIALDGPAYEGFWNSFVGALSADSCDDGDQLIGHCPTCDSIGFTVVYDTTLCTGDPGTYGVVITGLQDSAWFLYSWHSDTVGNGTIYIPYVQQDGNFEIFSLFTLDNMCAFQENFYLEDGPACDSTLCDSFVVFVDMQYGLACPGDTVEYWVNTYFGEAPYTYYLNYGGVDLDTIVTSSASVHGYFIFQSGVWATFTAIVSDVNFCQNYGMFTILEDSTCDSTSSVHDLNARYNTILYPNPASTQFTLQMDEVLPGSKLVLTNSLGQTLKTINVSQTKTYVDVSDLSKGFYFATLQYQNHILSTHKIAIQR